MRPLIISNKTRTEAQDLKEFAEDNIFCTDMMLDIKNGCAKPAGDDPNYVMNISTGYRVVYTVEQLDNIIFDHVSISIEDKKLIPNQYAVDEILGLFGFEPAKSKKNAVNIENVPGCGKVLNIISKR